MQVVNVEIVLMVLERCGLDLTVTVGIDKADFLMERENSRLLMVIYTKDNLPTALSMVLENLVTRQGMFMLGIL